MVQGLRGVALALLCACSLPDSYHLGTSYGLSEFDRPVNDFDTAAVYAGVSWHPGERGRHRESLDATRRLEIATVTHTLQPMPQDAAKSGDEEPHIEIPGPPKDRDEAWNLLIYGGFLLLMSVAALIGATAYKRWRSHRKNGTPKGDEA